ncbi:unnamed protein product [Tilletia controversa]|uniref:Succinate dehydrogenase assembly factor 3 n=3 Tax=Tilletia TaxID=13289 RepID=A0A8X7MPG6_9BASI|nr:hypothetical protein CF336_g5555 [Tilletia laevis]KAE8193593.1 hypothetical protein CF328_g5005 [Tilletia controversa]KAE8257037.1 hypothetical protein A4X03_0g4806 [Tilletia caries]KAE8244053.1 hypothetical protein A4X06_0g5994 [Tilletia controversa]CAD6887962.1 unnamed protein product [Tilletia caries]
MRVTSFAGEKKADLARRCPNEPTSIFVAALLRPVLSGVSVQQSRLASSSSSSPSGSSSNNPHSQHFNLTPTAQALLPPIPLYRRILRAHRYALSAEMRSLGDAYIKDEFRRHRKADNPLHLIGFLSQWKLYLDTLEVDRGIGLKTEGRRLDPDLLEKLSEEQVHQLYELYSHLLVEGEGEGEGEPESSKDQK